MGIMDAIGGGVGQAAQGVADVAMDQIKSLIDQERAAALIQMKEDSSRRLMRDQSDLAIEQDQKMFEQKKARAPEQDAIDATRERTVGAAKTEVEVDKQKKTLDTQRDAIIESGSNKQFLDAKRRLAVAEIDPTTAKGRELDNQIKQISVDNAKRVDALKNEFQSASPERKTQITEEVQLLTGKDNDSYLPVPMKDETGAITGYKIFDKKRGTWADDKGGGALQDVTVAGKVIGKARTMEEAQAMVAQYKKAGTSEPAKQVAKPGGGGIMSAPQAFNEAGYSDAESTIAGAERGDTKAKALLRTMLEEGGLTTGQRARINKIL